MKSSLFLLLFAFCLPFFGNSQVIFQGNVLPGDTTQSHVLTTKTGDRLIGRVLSADSAQVVFLFKNTNRLVFQTAEIERIAVLGEENLHEEAASRLPEKKFAEPGFEYVVYMKTGKPMQGVLGGYVGQEFRLARDPGMDDYLPEKNVERIELVSPRLDEARDLPAKMHFLKTKRGDQFVGQVVGFDSSTLRFLLETGTTLKFSLTVIQSVRFSKLPEKILPGFADNAPIPMHGQEKLFLSPSGFMLEKKSWQYSNYFLFYNTIDYGVSEHFTLGGGLFTVFSENILNVRAKFGASLSEKVHVAAGGQLFGYLASYGDNGTGLLGFGTITLGTPERFLNAGVTYFSSSPEQTRFSTLNFGGSFRIGRKWRLFGEINNVREVYETEFFSDYDSYWIFIFGASWFNHKHRFDFGLAPINDGFYTFAVPALSYAYKFGGN